MSNPPNRRPPVSRAPTLAGQLNTRLSKPVGARGRMLTSDDPEEPVEQKLAVGHISQSAASRLGAFRETLMQVDPYAARVALVGRLGHGKSSLLHACPWMHVNNVDLSPTPRRPKALIFPGVRKDRTPVRAHPDFPNDPEKGEPFVPTWEDFLEQKKILIEMARDDVPGRPRASALDGVDNAVPLVQAWMVEQHNKKYPEADPIASFDDIKDYGKWDEFYNQIVNFGLDLNAVGYGFWWTIHLGSKNVRKGGESEYLDNTTLIQANLFNKIASLSEIVATIFMESKVVQIDVEQKTPRGPRVVKRTERQKQVTMCFEPSERNASAKTRYASMVGELVLDRLDPWSSFEKEVRRALAADSK